MPILGILSCLVCPRIYASVLAWMARGVLLFIEVLRCQEFVSGTVGLLAYNYLYCDYLYFTSLR
jgi:hypothetical protein